MPTKPIADPSRLESAGVHKMPSPLQLRTLRLEDEPSFRDAVAAFADETPPFQFAFDYDPGEDFARYVKKLESWAAGIDVPERFVPNSFLVGVVEEIVVGRLSLRHTLNANLRAFGGHIGYGVVPSQRRKGYAGEMLRQALPLCRQLGIDRVLISCDVDNRASRKVIERAGGQYDSTTDLPELDVQKRIYWIPIQKTDTCEPARSSLTPRRKGSP